jgi:hypothetical protein
MPPPPGRRSSKPSRTEHRALRLLAGSRDGCTEAVMLAHGFTVETMVALIQAGLARATTERVVAPGYKGERAWVKITEAGRRALGQL